VIVRDERPDDVEAIRTVVTAAFERAAEAQLVDALRDAGAATLSLVAEHDGRVVGHVAFSPVTILPLTAEPTRATSPPASGLAPLAVLPALHRRGVGGALVRAGLDRCRATRVAVVVVLGSPAYYGRFGFVDAARFRVRCEYEAPPGAFQLLELRPGALSGEPALARYRDEFATF
jgi:putative acetyltransferase